MNDQKPEWLDAYLNPPDKATLARKALDKAMAEINAVLADPAASFWLKDQLRALMTRDPCDADEDAAKLAHLISEWSIGVMLVVTAGQKAP